MGKRSRRRTSNKSGSVPPRVRTESPTATSVHTALGNETGVLPAGLYVRRPSNSHIPAFRTGSGGLASSPLALQSVPPMYLRSASTTTGAPVDRSRPAAATPRSPVPTPPVADTASAATPAAALPTGCADTVAAVDPGIASTCLLEASAVKPSVDLHVRFVGTRTDPADPNTARPDSARDRFERVIRVGSLPSGQAATVTTRVQDIAAGTWRVVATPFDPARPREIVGSAQTSVSSTRLKLLAQGPGVRLWTWPALVGLGAVLAVIMLGFSASARGWNTPGVVMTAVLGCVFGYIGAKCWYLALHRKHLRHFGTAGACIQGFLVVSLATLVAGGAAMSIDIGSLLDATTPGLFLAMAVGRPGCFFTGCCAGRPTGSRFGVWSSDRRIGVRRVPVQLLEAAAALVIGLVSLFASSSLDAPGGVVFSGAVAAYTLSRQVLFPYRADPHTRRGRAVTIALCLVVLVGVGAALITSS